MRATRVLRRIHRGALALVTVTACVGGGAADRDAGRPPATSCAQDGGAVPEGMVCDVGAGSVCVRGRCETPTPIAIQQSSPYGLVVVGGNAYWANQTTAGCALFETDCGQIVTTAVTSNQDTGTVLWSGGGVDVPNYVAANGDTIGFTCDGRNSSANTMAQTGGAQAILFYSSAGSAVTTPAGCAMTATTLYWADTDQGLLSAPVDGSAPPRQLASGTPTAVAVDTRYVYWSDNTAGTIVRADLDGSDPQTLATGLGEVLFLAADGHNLYYADFSSGIVAQVPSDGGPQTILAEGERAPTGIAVDGNDVYWADNADGTIRRAQVGGGAPTTVAVQQNYPAAVAVDADNVYWTNNNGDTVMRLAR
jgi:hypothetical protein